MIEIRLPKPGPEIEVATLTRWECSVGDQIRCGDILAIIKTSIGSFKVAAEEEGVLTSILQPDGATINFEEPIAILHPENVVPAASVPAGQQPQPEKAAEPAPKDPPKAEPPQEQKKTEPADSSKSDPPKEVEEAVAVEPPVEFEEEVAFEPDPEPVQDPVKTEAPPEPQEVKAPSKPSPAKVKETPKPVSFPAPPRPAEKKTATKQGLAEPGVPSKSESKKPYVHQWEPTVEISPAARIFAERNGVDLAEVKGTGGNGKILYIDVERVIEARIKEEAEKQPAPEESIAIPEEEIPSEKPAAIEKAATEPESEKDLEAKADPEPETTAITDTAEEPSEHSFDATDKSDLKVPFNKISKQFAIAQTRSNSTVPHLRLHTKFDTTRAIKWLNDFNQRNKSGVTLTHLIVKNCGHALSLMPELNSFVSEDHITIRRSINIAFTTPVKAGVMLPVITDVYHKSLLEVAKVFSKNEELANSGSTEEQKEATFTITSVENWGITSCETLIIPPQACCLSIGSLQKKVVPVDDFVGIRQILSVNLACDHRAIEIRKASRFLNTLRENLEKLTPGEDPDWIQGFVQLHLI